MAGDSKRSDTEAWLNLAGALAWPAIGLLAIILFYGPIRASLDRVSQGDAEEVNVGAVKIRFSSNRLSEMPRPSAVVAEKINALSEFDREMLISIGSYTPHDDTCTIEGFEAAVRSGTEVSNRFFATRIQHLEEFRRHIGSHARLRDLGLVRIDNRPNSGEPFCLDGQGRTARITPLGEQTRRYYLDLVNSALSVTSTPP